MKTVDVLIVGAGPTGLALALELTRAGISHLIIDGKAGPSTIMKATALTPTTLEFFEDLGCSDACLEQGTRVRYLTLYAEGQKIVERSWDSLDSPFPFMTLLGQHRTEKILMERLLQLGGQVKWNCRLTGLEVGSEVTAQLEDGPVEARFLVGCDGSHSTVARLLGAEYHDLDFPTDYVVAELSIDSDMPRQDWQVFFAEQGPLAAGAMPDNRWGIMAALPRRAEPYLGTEPTLAELQAIWDERSPFPGRLHDPQWMSFYRDHARTLKSPLPGPVILAGDAVHQVSPLSSLGMNSGFLDARNLGWKLALVCRGLAGPELLASYHQEHRTQVVPALVLSVLNEIAYPFQNVLLRKYRDLSYRLLLNFDPIWNFYIRYQSQKERHLRSSPIVSEQSAFPIHLPSSPHLSDHGSCLKAFLAFGEGPHAGDPARDCSGLQTEEGQSTRLFPRMFAGQHTLLVFACARPTAATRGYYQELERGLTTLPEGFVRSWMIAPQKLPGEIWSGPTLLDPDGVCRARYGAEGECLYLIRPDGYVAFRCQPPLWSWLRDYLATTFSGLGLA